MEIRIKKDSAGRKKATYYSKQLSRWMPIKLEAALLLIATGKAEQV